VGTSGGERAAFEERGYLVFDPGIPGPLIDEAVRDLGVMWGAGRSAPAAGDSPLEERSLPRIRHAWKRSAAVRRMTTWPRVLELLHEIYGRDAFAFQTLSFHVGTEQHLHSDAIHFNSWPTGLMCGVWIALEDMDATNGALVYVPGSHRWPQYGMEDVGVPSARIYYRAYEEFIGRKLAESGARTEVALVRKGQAFLWHGNLLHGGGPRTDRRRTRLSHVTHYAVESCGMWAPIRSRGKRRFVRNQRPIRPSASAVGDLRWLARFAHPWFVWHAVTHNLPHLVKTTLLRQN
jgi:hypothetical protein